MKMIHKSFKEIDVEVEHGKKIIIKKINKNSENVPIKHINSRIIWCT